LSSEHELYGKTWHMKQEFLAEQSASNVLVRQLPLIVLFILLSITAILWHQACGQVELIARSAFGISVGIDRSRPLFIAAIGTAASLLVYLVLWIILVGRERAMKMAIGMSAELKVSKRNLEISNERMALATNASGIGVWDWDVVGNALVWDEQMYRLYGVLKEDFKGAYEAWSTLLHPEDFARANEDIQAALRGERKFDTEFRVTWHDGCVHNIKATGITISDERGEPVRMVGINYDITERTKAAEAIKSAFEAKSAFTSTVSHELRTPLTIIKESIDIVSEGLCGAVNEEQTTFLATAKRNVDRLTRLINDVLDMQKLDAGMMQFHMKDGDIAKVVHEVVGSMSSLAANKGLLLTASLPAGLPSVRFDEDKMIQVLTNLINNALKFTDKGSITVAAELQDCFVKVSVADTGLGVRKEDMSRLFGKFEQLYTEGQRKTGGTGLGLAICKEIIERHNGKIWAESEFGKGTVFCFMLPVVEKGA